MRVLLLHPEDSPMVGPWSRQRWDLIVDLGNSSPFSAETWSRESGCPVVRAASYPDGIADARCVRGIFSAGRGRLLDQEGIDWWELTSLLLMQEAMTVLTFRRMAGAIMPSAELWSTRSTGGPAELFAIVTGRDLHTFGEQGLARSTARILRYAGLARRFSFPQVKEILLDKYDPAYRWRSRFAPKLRNSAEAVVLIPSAYTNVSRMAAAYARLLPRQSFLMVTTRQSGRQFVPPPNVHLRDLAAYAKDDPPQAEIASLLDRWAKLRNDICSIPELQVLSRAGALDPIAGWIRDGITVRDAWGDVLEHEPVCGVLCGDDSNRYTLLPVLLASRRKIPTVDFHHGAFDGRYLMKSLPSDIYMAKNEMERDYLLRVCGLPAEKVVIGAPYRDSVIPARDAGGSMRMSAILFSEPYEVANLRAAEVYRELLPPLCRLVREKGRRLIIKLHPFESRSQRSRIVDEVLEPEDRALVSVIDGPPTPEIMAQAWFGLTVESTSAVDCRQSGVHCFLCGWLTFSPFGYAQQYARFGVGEVLQSAEQISGIPQRLVDFEKRPAMPWNLSPTADPEMLQSWLTSGLREPVGARPAS